MSIQKLLVFILNIVAALAALAAAFFWFQSAAVRLPPTPIAFDVTAKNDKLHEALQSAARLNRWAAAFSGISALSVGLSTALEQCSCSA